MSVTVKLYAGTQEGLFLWRSKNASWDQAALAFENSTIDAIDGPRSRPATVFVSVTRDGIYRTDDAGKKWERIFEGNVRAITMDPTDDRVIYAGTEPIRL